MVFNSWVFLLAFLPAVYTLFWLARTRQQRYLLLTVSGFVFYGYWDWRFCFLLLFSSMVSFTVGLAIQRAQEPRVRKSWMVLAISVDLSLLGFFKYYDFFASSIDALLPGRPLPLLHVILPIGISFYTFHTISYIVDVYARRVKATSNLFEYLTYVSLFSQLVAGPIVRYRQIEDDLDAIGGPPRYDWTARGLMFFTVGMVKKVIVADHIAQYIDPMLSSWTTLSTVEAWTAALGYTAQLYFDFSGYSDMAVGLGYLFMLRIPQNFNQPYHALGIADFWRRWHISLSTWLRDYLYIPLGGNRGSTWQTYRNLLVVMVLGGLWHGANWTFVIWGAYHGLLLAAERAAGDVVRRIPPLLYRAATFAAVVVGWVIFRSTDITMAMGWLSKMFIPTGDLQLPVQQVAMWLALAYAWIVFIPEPWDFRQPRRVAWAIAHAVLFFLALLSMSGRESVFLYYQF